MEEVLPEHSEDKDSDTENEEKEYIREKNSVKKFLEDLGQRISGILPSGGYNQDVKQLKQRVSELETETDNIEEQEKDEVKNISHLSKRIKKLEQKTTPRKEIEEIKETQEEIRDQKADEKKIKELRKDIKSLQEIEDHLDDFLEPEDLEKIEENVIDLEEKLGGVEKDLTEELNSKADRKELKDLEEKLKDSMEEDFEDLKAQLEEIEVETENRQDKLEDKIDSSASRDSLEELRHEVKDLREDESALEEKISSIEGKTSEIRENTEKVSELEEKIQSLDEKISETKEQEEKVSKQDLDKLWSKLEEKADRDELKDMEYFLQQENSNSNPEKRKEKTPDHQSHDERSENTGETEKNILRDNFGQKKSVTPSAVSKRNKGKELNVQGMLTLQSKSSDYYLYTLEGAEDIIGVIADEKVEDGQAIVEGTLREIDDSLYLDMR